MLQQEILAITKQGPDREQAVGLFDDLSSYMAGTASVLFGKLQR